MGGQLEGTGGRRTNDFDSANINKLTHTLYTHILYTHILYTHIFICTHTYIHRSTWLLISITLALEHKVQALTERQLSSV